MLAASEHSLTAHPAVGLWMPSVGVPAHVPPASALHPSCNPPAPPLCCVPATSVPLEAATRAVLDLGLCLGPKCHGAGGPVSAPGEGLGGGNGYRAGDPTPGSFGAFGGPRGPSGKALSCPMSPRCGDVPGGQPSSRHHRQPSARRQNASGWEETSSAESQPRLR